jgi:hypothetical protein
MMQASVDAAHHDRRLQEEQRQDGVSGMLRSWHEASSTLHAAIERARGELVKDGTPRDQIARVAERLVELQKRAKSFDLDRDLDECVGHWKSLSLELGQLSGKHRDTLLKVLGGKQQSIDKVTSDLSQARSSGGMAPEKYRKVREVQAERDRSREKYERLRQKYLDAEQAHAKAASEAARAKPGQHAPRHAAHGLVPAGAHAAAKHGPVVVKLPDAHKAGSGVPAAVQHRSQVPAHQAPRAPAHRAPHAPRAAAPPSSHSPEHRSPHAAQRIPHIGMPAPHKPTHAQPATHGAQPPQHPTHGERHATHGGHSLRGAQRAAVGASAGAPRAAGPLKISLEKVERPVGFPTGTDGIGRGNQAAHLFFRAEHFDGSLSVAGAATIELGCAARLYVAPSLHLFSGVPGAPIRGRLTLGLVSTGGQLRGVSPRTALDNARSAARSAAAGVAGKIGPIGEQLESAIAAVLTEAVSNIFSRAQPQATPHRAPHRQAAPSHGGHQRAQLPVEHHVARFNHALGAILHEARAVKGAGEHRPQLHRIVERSHAHGDGVASRLEQTLGHLATASHRTLTDSHAGDLRNHLARMDSILAKLRGKRGDELLQGAHEVGQILSSMGSIASTAGGAPHVANFRKLIAERRDQLAHIAGEARKGDGAHAHRQPGAPLQHMPSAQVLGEKALERLRRHHPGLDKLLRNASSSQLAQELAKVERGALQALGGHAHGRHGPAHHGLGTAGFGGIAASLGGGHLGGLGGGHRGGALGQTQGQGALHALHRQHEQILHREIQKQGRGHSPQQLAMVLGDLKKAPAGSPLHALAEKTERRKKELATKYPARNKPPPALITAAAFQDVFKHHAKGSALAGHFGSDGVLGHLLSAAQRSHGLPISQMASHYLQSRGHANVWNAVQMFHGLVKEGHKPRFGFWSHLKDSVSNTVRAATNMVSNTVQRAASVIQHVSPPVAAR